jgi:hypothetical protein
LQCPGWSGKGETGDLAAIAAGTHKVALAHVLNPWVADGEGKPLHSVDPLAESDALSGRRQFDPSPA